MFVEVKAVSGLRRRKKKKEQQVKLPLGQP
jgi:hypothetical protein